MPKIMHGGKEYSGGSGGGGGTSSLEAIELTQSEYSNLSPAEKTDLDKIYFLTDGGGGSSYSKTVIYTNTGSSAANITLTSDYTNYDELYFECIRGADGRGYIVPYYMLTDDLSSVGNFQLFGWDEYCSYAVTNSTTFTKLNNSGSWYIKKIYGIKH